MRKLFFIFISLIYSTYAFAQDVEKGGIVIKSNVEDHFLIIDNDFENAVRLSDSDTLFLDPGTYRFKLASPQSNDFSFQEEILPDSIIVKRVNLISRFYTHELNSYAPLFWKANLMVFSEESANIYVNNNRVGTSIAGVKTDREYAIITVNNGTYSATKTVRVLPSRLQVFTVTTLPIKQKAIILSALPGASQVYKKQYVKGSAFLVGLISATTTAILFNNRFEEADKDFLRYRSLYNGSTNPIDVLRFGNLAEKSLNDAERYSELRNAALFTAGAVYLINIADGLLSKPKRGFFEPWDFDPFIDFSPNNQPEFGIQISRDLK